jgi:hypothetical protein
MVVTNFTEINNTDGNTIPVACIKTLDFDKKWEKEKSSNRD